MIRPNAQLVPKDTTASQGRVSPHHAQSEVTRPILIPSQQDQALTHLVRPVPPDLIALRLGCQPQQHVALVITLRVGPPVVPSVMQGIIVGAIPRPVLL